MSEIAFEDKMRIAVQEIQKWGLEYANYRPLADHLDELKKTILSSEILKYAEEAAWKAEAKARTSEAYLVHLDGLKVAHERANMAWAKLEAAKAKFDALRSLLSYEKKQMETFKE